MSTPRAPSHEPGPPLSDRRLWDIRWLRDLAWLAAVVAVGYLAYKVRAILAPVTVGLALAYAVNPIVCFLQRRLRLPRWAGTGVILLAVAVVLGLAALILAPIAWHQASELIQKTPGYVDRVVDQAAPTAESWRKRGDIWLRRFLPPKARPGGAGAAAAPSEVGTPPATPDERHVAASRPSASEADTPLLDLSAVNWSQAGTVLFTGFSSGLTLLGMTIALGAYLILAFIIALFCFIIFSWKFDRILAWGREFVPIHHEADTLRILGRMDNAVSSFLRGRLIQITILAINLTITWWLAGVPYFVLLAIGTAMLNIVPYASFIGLPIAIITLWVDRTTGGGGFSALAVIVWPAVAFLIPQQLDNWVIEPVVQGKATSLDPLSVMLAVATGGALLGILGVVIAIPSAACIKILLQEVVLPKLRRLARPPGSPPLPPADGVTAPNGPPPAA